LCEKHRIFLDDFASNAAALDAQHGVIGWRVVCGHCSMAVAGAVKESGQTVSVLWTHDGSSWFGSFKSIITGALK
jgi:hypothetical protein